MTYDDVVPELDAELALIEQLPYRVPIHLLAQRARDEIVALRAQLKAVKGIAGNERKLSEAIIQQARDEALEEAAQLHENINPACDHEREHGAPGAGAMGAVIRYRDAIRALKGPRP